MPLTPDISAPWPPANLDPIRRDMRIADAWWSGDPQQLALVYGDAGTPRPRRRSFWTRRTTDPRQAKERIHVPAASDVAATAADLLFGDGIRLVSPDADATARLGELIDEDSGVASLIEAADVASGLGGVYLRPVWDATLAARPLIDVVHADHAVPEWRWGLLTAVTFWWVVQEQHGAVTRHLERHEPGAIYHGLYVGDSERLGRPVSLTDDPSTEGLAALVDVEGAIRLPTGMDRVLLPRYVPNALPNRRHRGVRHGRPDCTTYGLMDALDETMTSWVRDIRLARARLVVPDEYLDRRGRGQGATFDEDQEIFSPLPMDPATRDGAHAIEAVQFEIRAEEHEATCRALFERIVGAARYSPQSFGQHGDGSQQTATEVESREDRSHRTTHGKRRYWAPALSDVALHLLLLDQALFGGPGPGPESARPMVEWPDLDGRDEHLTAQTIDLLARARAASIQTRVQLAHPDWDQATVEEETARIQAEEGLMVDDPTGGLP